MLIITFIFYICFFVTLSATEQPAIINNLDIIEEFRKSYWGIDKKIELTPLKLSDLYNKRLSIGKIDEEKSNGDLYICQDGSIKLRNGLDMSHIQAIDDGIILYSSDEKNILNLIFI